MFFNRIRVAARHPLPECLSAVLFFICTACAFTPVAAGQTDPRAYEGRISVEFFPTGEAEKTNPVVLSFSGKLYDNVLLPEPGKPSALADDEKAVAKIIATNRRGTLEELLQLWNPPERTEIRRLASDPQLFDANRKFYGTIAKSFLRAKIYYGSYVIFIVRHTDGASGEVMKDYPLKRVGDEYLATNALSNDPVFQYLTTKYLAKLRGR